MHVYKRHVRPPSRLSFPSLDFKVNMNRDYYTPGTGMAHRDSKGEGLTRKREVFEAADAPVAQGSRQRSTSRDTTRKCFLHHRGIRDVTKPRCLGPIAGRSSSHARSNLVEASFEMWPSRYGGALDAGPETYTSGVRGDTVGARNCYPKFRFTPAASDTHQANHNAAPTEDRRDQYLALTNEQEITIHIVVVEPHVVSHVPARFHFYVDQLKPDGRPSGRTIRSWCSLGALRISSLSCILPAGVLVRSPYKVRRSQVRA